MIDERILGLRSNVGTGFETINDNNRDTFFPLLFGIEEEIFLRYKEDASLTDSEVVDSLKKIGDNIFCDKFQFNVLESAIVRRIKAVLLLNDYNKRDVSLSISYILNSTKLHSAVDGKIGYLSFISEFFSKVERCGIDDGDYSDDSEDDGFWSEGAYFKSISSSDSDFEERMKYFEEKADEKKEHNCKKCNKKIGKHNLYWHEGMCNDCFFDEYGM